MPNTRRDQMQAYAFVGGRLRAGMLQSEPDTLDAPAARTWRGALVGLIVAALICLVVALVGVIVPGGNDSWRQNGTLVLVSDTGARYLYTDELHPVLNETSARLYAGDKLQIATVGESSLSGARIGQPFGLVGAPDSLPSPDHLNTGAWLACSVSTAAASGASTRSLVVRIGDGARRDGLTTQQGLLVTDGTSDYLLWNARRFRLDTAHGAAVGLGYATATPQRVPAGLLNAVPAGPDLTAPELPGLGTAGPTLASRSSRVGQLFADSSGQRYVLTTEGLRPLTATAFDLVRALPTLQSEVYAGKPPTVAMLGPDDLRLHASAVRTALGSGTLPKSPPPLVTVSASQGICAQVESRPQDSTSTTSVVLVENRAILAGATPPPALPGVIASCTPATDVAIPPGDGAYVAASTAAGALGNAAFLVTDNGVKYPVPGAQSARLGYSPAETVLLPTSLLRLLPTGPSLDAAQLAHGGVVSAAAPQPCTG